MHKTILLAALLGLVPVGCGPLFTHATKDPMDFAQESSACLHEAYDATSDGCFESSPGAQTGCLFAVAIMRRQFYRLCMEAQGWQKVGTTVLGLRIKH